MFVVVSGRLAVMGVNEQIADTEARTLAVKAAGGDARAFARLVEAHYDFIYALSMKICGHRQDAEDLAQAVCIKLGSVLSQYKGNAAFKTWLYQIVLNAGRDKLRQRISAPQTLADDDIYQSNEPDAERVLVSKAAYKAVQDLPEKYREAVLLVFAEGMNHAEAAKVLGCTEGNISWRIHEARKRLRVALKGLWP